MTPWDAVLNALNVLWTALQSLGASPAKIAMYAAGFAINTGLSWMIANWAARKGWRSKWWELFLVGVVLGCVISALVVNYLPSTGLPVGAPRARKPLPRAKPLMHHAARP